MRLTDPEFQCLQRREPRSDFPAVCLNFGPAQFEVGPEAPALGGCGEESRYQAELTPGEICPVAALLPDLEHIVAAELAADDAFDEDRLSSAAKERADLQARIIGLQANSTTGAKLQLLLALERGELVRSSTRQVERDSHHDELERLIRSAMTVTGAPVADRLWSFYAGGSQGAEELTLQTSGAPTRGHTAKGGQHG